MKRNKLTMLLKVALVIKALIIAPYLIINARSLHEDYLMSKIEDRSVKIVSPKNHNSGGTGFPVYAASGTLYTLTNAHVCEVAQNGVVHASIAGSDRYYTLRVLDVSNKTDLCLLEAMPNMAGLSLGSGLGVGDDIIAVGHSLLMPSVMSRGRIISFQTIEIVSGVNQKKEVCEEAGGEWIDLSGTQYEFFFGMKSSCIKKVYSALTNMPVFPGNSGSPVVNFFGNVVGVVFAGRSDTNYGYIIPLNDIKTFLEVY